MIIDIKSGKGFVDSKIIDSDDIIGIRFLALAGNQKVEKIELKNLEILEASSVQNCPELKSFYLPSIITKIADGTFSDCVKLTDINIENIKHFGKLSFKGTGLKELNLFGIKKIDDYAFAHSKIKSIIIDGLEHLGPVCFAECYHLKTAKLKNLERLENSAFKNCKALETVELVNVRHIDDDIFAGCDNLKNIILSGEIESIFSNFKLPAGATIYYNGSKSDFDKIDCYAPIDSKRIITKDSLDELIVSGMSMKDINKIYKQFEELSI